MKILEKNWGEGKGKEISNFRREGKGKGKEIEILEGKGKGKGKKIEILEGKGKGKGRKFSSHLEHCTRLGMITTVAKDYEYMEYSCASVKSARQKFQVHLPSFACEGDVTVLCSGNTE